jgi:hypothetical protein
MGAMSFATGIVRPRVTIFAARLEDTRRTTSSAAGRLASFWWAAGLEASSEERVQGARADQGVTPHCSEITFSISENTDLPEWTLSITVGQSFVGDPVPERPERQ